MAIYKIYWKNGSVSVLDLGDEAVAYYRNLGVRVEPYTQPFDPNTIITTYPTYTTSFGEATNQNLVSLGVSATQQQEQINSLQTSLNEINTRVSEQLTNLGKSLNNASKSAGGTGLLSNIGLALGVGGAGALIAVGVVLFLVLKK